MNSEADDPVPSPAQSDPPEIVEPPVTPETEPTPAATASPTDVDQETAPDLLLMAVLVEGALIAIALLLAWFGIYDRSQPLTKLDSESVLWPAAVGGLISLIPMLLLLVATIRLDWAFFRSLRETVEEQLVPLFGSLTVPRIALISLLAGLGEELLFRWSLQGGLTEWLEFPGGAWVAAVLAAFLFGFCHFVTWQYAVLTTLIGVYLGGVMIVSGTYLAPALAHAAYDFIALLVITRWPDDEEIGEKSQ